MMREGQIDSLANYIVKGLVDRGAIKPHADTDALVACVVELLSENFETEARIDDEAERMAEQQAREHPGVDVTRLRAMIRQRLAEKRGFTL